MTSRTPSWVSSTELLVAWLLTPRPSSSIVASVLASAGLTTRRATVNRSYERTIPVRQCASARVDDIAAGERPGAAARRCRARRYGDRARGRDRVLATS